MAQREAPEINAGSMADIAFLLLIFFLVTTTMDKDTAYLRKIPKKVESKIQPPPVEEKNIYKIVINSKQVIQARDSIIEPEDISTLNSRIKHFYTVNRDRKTDRALDYPYYAFGTKELYSNNLITQQNRLDALENRKVIDDKTSKMIDQTLVAIEKWNEKLEMMNLYTEFSGKKEMPEIAFEAHIRLESFVDTDYSAYVAVQSEVQRAVTELRDEEAMALFGITWTAMNRYIQQNKLEDTPELRLYQEHVELIETLYPLRLIEVKPKR
ncbi:ExbD/TolR family protein [Brumimicrobium aurantiacum]|uniref:Biopolymer transporter ExbD n=1 Tax=Brumimicrobium aurantiacum TaxID=1737063 RepID=A0A3E1EX76_9FLAO|nr:biopolymer transporter ExbD [Brumimicrobium aurantiacum]RFC54147.1 biopolymer transporter ExbD [Brumimicrobium aurantiacum]